MTDTPADRPILVAQIAALREIVGRNDVAQLIMDMDGAGNGYGEIADAIIPLVRAAERERCAAWHDGQAAWHDERADHPVTMIDGNPSKIGQDLAAHRRRQAAWHREAAAAIRASGAHEEQP
jgi:hypothetical protein